MVSFFHITLIVFLIFFEGLVYAFFSDLTDFFVPIFFNGALSSYNTVESINGFNILMSLFKYSLMAYLIFVAYKIWQTSQKPEREGWR